MKYIIVKRYNIHSWQPKTTQYSHRSNNQQKIQTFGLCVESEMNVNFLTQMGWDLNPKP